MSYSVYGTDDFGAKIDAYEPEGVNLVMEVLKQIGIVNAVVVDGQVGGYVTHEAIASFYKAQMAPELRFEAYRRRALGAMVSERDFPAALGYIERTIAMKKMDRATRVKDW